MRSRGKTAGSPTESDFINILDDKSGTGTSSVPVKMTLSHDAPTGAGLTPNAVLEPLCQTPKTDKPKASGPANTYRVLLP